MQVGIYEELRGVVCQPQKNVRDNVKENWRNRHLQPGQLWIFFQPNQTRTNPQIKTPYLPPHQFPPHQKVRRGK